MDIGEFYTLGRNVTLCALEFETESRKNAGKQSNKKAVACAGESSQFTKADDWQTLVRILT